MRARRGHGQAERRKRSDRGERIIGAKLAINGIPFDLILCPDNVSCVLYKVETLGEDKSYDTHVMGGK